MKLLVTFVISALFAVSAAAQQSKMFGPYELHFSVLNTTFLDPKVAATYDITRGDKRGIINLAVRKHVDTGTEPVALMLKGKTWDLIQGQPLEFQEIREGPAVYYIAEFKFINEEWRFFEIHFRPEGGDTTYTHKFKHQLYIN